MKHWTITASIDPSKLEGVVSGRFVGDVELSGSVLFVAYSRSLRQWYHVWGGGHEEKIDEPGMIFVEEDWARENRSLGQRHKRENPTRIRKKTCEQLQLSL